MEEGRSDQFDEDEKPKEMANMRVFIFCADEESKNGKRNNDDSVRDAGLDEGVEHGFYWSECASRRARSLLISVVEILLFSTR